MPRQQKRGQRTFKCDFPNCEKTYKHRSSLVRHSRTHASRRSRYNLQSPAVCCPKEINSPVESICELDENSILVPRRTGSGVTTPRSGSDAGFTLFSISSGSFQLDFLPDSIFPDLQTILPRKQNEYSYHEILPNQLRLLLVCKGDVDDPLDCRIQIVNEDDLANQRRAYQALSYAWGESDNKHEIFLSDLTRTKTEPSQIIRSIPRRFYVQPNLFKALKQIRSATRDLWFWIDAICIDQDNDIEKSQQLPKMLDIFSKATNVCIWLGESDNSVHSGHQGMQFVTSIINLKLLDRMVSGALANEKTVDSWLAFANLLRRHWFRRRWVIQEVAAARSVSIQCGKMCINWIDFADAVQLFVSKLDLIRLQYEGSELSQKYPDGLKHIESFGAKAIVGITNDVLRKTEGGDVLERLYSIEFLVMQFQHFDVSDPRDTVYALLPLANDGHQSTRDGGILMMQPSLVPDYTKPTLQVYIEFIRHCVLSSGSLDIICRHWALPLKEPSRKPSVHMPELRSGTKARASAASEFPSWIGLAADTPFGPPSLFTGRINGDSLVGEPGHRIYNASGSRLVSAYFGKVDETAESENGGLFDGTLYASGIILCKVSRASSRVVDGVISDESLAIAGWTNDDDIDDIPDRVWKTLVADRASDEKNAPFWYRRACIYCLRNTSPEGDLNTSMLITNPTLPETVVDYLKRVQAVVWSRKFLICHDLNDDSMRLYGLGSRYTEMGDLVCILFGCAVPVILRKHKDGFYEFIGESYIYGKMDGEAFAGLNKDTIASAVVEFNIR